MMQKQVLAARNDFVNALFKKLDIDIILFFILFLLCPYRAVYGLQECTDKVMFECFTPNVYRKVLKNGHCKCNVNFALCVEGHQTDHSPYYNNREIRNSDQVFPLPAFSRLKLFRGKSSYSAYCVFSSDKASPALIVSLCLPFYD